MPRPLIAPTILATLLGVTPSLVTAQRIARPCPSSVGNAGSSAPADSTLRNLGSEGWTASERHRRYMGRSVHARRSAEPLWRRAG
jgi:hypothetical protein